jgi:hypothetical protein
LENRLKMKPENYIKSQRVKYLTLGALAGFFIGLNDEPYRTPMIFAFVLIGLVVSWRLSKR